MSYDQFRAEQTEKLNTIFEALDAETLDKDSIKSSITSVLEAQATYGKTQYDKKQSQIKKFEEVLDAIGYEGESVKDFAKKFKEDKSAIDTTKTEKEQLVERIKRLEAEDAQRKEEQNRLKAENEKNIITSKLTEAIGNRLKGSKYIIKDLIRENKVTLVDGEVMFVEGDDVVLFDKGVESVLESNADLVVNKQNAGISTTKTIDNDKKSSGLTLEQINKMSPDELKIHMSEIKKIAGVR